MPQLKLLAQCQCLPIYEVRHPRFQAGASISAPVHKTETRGTTVLHMLPRRARKSSMERWRRYLRKNRPLDRKSSSSRLVQTNSADVNFFVLSTTRVAKSPNSELSAFAPNSRYKTPVTTTSAGSSTRNSKSSTVSKFGSNRTVLSKCLPPSVEKTVMCMNPDVLGIAAPFAPSDCLKS